MSVRTPWDVETEAGEPEEAQERRHREVPARVEPPHRGEAANYALARFKAEFEKRLAEERRKALNRSPDEE